MQYNTRAHFPLYSAADLTRRRHSLIGKRKQENGYAGLRIARHAPRIPCATSRRIYLAPADAPVGANGASSAPAPDRAPRIGARPAMRWCAAPRPGPCPAGTTRIGGRQIGSASNELQTGATAIGNWRRQGVGDATYWQSPYGKLSVGARASAARFPALRRRALELDAFGDFPAMHLDVGGGVDA